MPESSPSPTSPSTRVGLWLGLVAAGALVWAAAVALTGGFVLTLGPIAFSSRKPAPALAVAALALAGLALRALANRRPRVRRLAAGAARAAAAADVRGRAWLQAARPAAPWLALALAAFSAIQAYRLGADAVGGQDSWGYASEAALIAQGRLHADEPSALTSPWPNADWSWAPLAYRPAPTPGAIVPIYPVGYPATMALFRLAAGPEAIFLVVPVFAFVAVLAAYRLAARFDGPAIGLAAAAWLAASPVFVFQSRMPMSDVPATAWWLLALVAVDRSGPGRAWLGGLAAGAAVVTRPNLVPLAVPIALYLLLRRANGRGARAGVADAAAFSAGLLPACLAVAWINATLVGSPLANGYGQLHDLYAWSHLGANLARYPAWLVSTETPLVLAFLAAPWAVRGDAGRVATIRLWLAFVAIVWAAYLFYLPFDAVWFLRFLLPALPLMLILAVATLAAAASKAAGVCGRQLAAVGFAVLLVWQGTRAAGMTEGVREFEHKFRAVGEYVGRALPPDAVVVAWQHSGSVRYYSGRETLRLDAIDAAWLDRAIAHLASAGRDVYFVVEENEEARFRDRFAAGSDLGRLDWPPFAELHVPGTTVVRVYDPWARSGRGAPRP